MISIKPAALDRDNAAAYLSISLSTMEKLQREGGFPRPRMLSGNRVGWIVTELDEWLHQRPVSNIAPPENTGAPKRKRNGTMAADT